MLPCPDIFAASDTVLLHMQFHLSRRGIAVPRNSLTRYTARYLRIRRLVQFILADPVYYNALTNCAARLCRACVDLITCVAERYLTMRTGCEKHGRKNPLPYSFSKRSHIGNLRRIRKQGKGRSSKRKENRRLSFLFAHRRGYGVVPAAGAALSRAPQSAIPCCGSAKNSPPVRVNRLRGSNTPLSRCRKIRAELINQTHLIKAYPKKTALSTQ